MRFYLGTHQPAWLARDLGVPLLVSHRRLAGRRSLPRASGPWALDSGGFTELSLHGRWRTDAVAYATAVRRYATEIGNLDWAAPRDWMTEGSVLARTGLSLSSHQRRTVTDYLRLRDLAPDLPFIPVLQGQSITDYHHCADLYERHGVDLATLPLVGVGSVCRRQHTAEVEAIVRALTARGYRLHTFGAKILGLDRYGDTITSSDSMSWSFSGRYVPGCSPTHRSESNCLGFALSWYRRVTQRLDSSPHTDTSSTSTVPQAERSDPCSTAKHPPGGSPAPAGPASATPSRPGGLSPAKRRPPPKRTPTTGRHHHRDRTQRPWTPKCC
ncbi:Phage protein [Actinokineospora spheciospongiae]|uniref:Phage protein n=1 Tax=Actinokineospora spheciospongiae TaxID=909613 RepID=W7JES5_9PSEU|nr:hypothetical protein [Actinokineospora spheciospongiae]EWC64484.1 Phage protein [Actinokineospora spheciospongiae]